MYRLSVTMIEKFRRYMVEETPFDTEEALVECIKGVFVGNDKTTFGGAFHKILEGDYQYLQQSKQVKADGVLFPYALAKTALDFRKEHKQISHEIPVQKVYQTARFPVLVGGRVDAIEGLFIRDSKCKFRNIDIREYLESCQWKFYLDMLSANTFWYDLFEVKGFEGLEWKGNNADQYALIKGDVHIIQHESIDCTSFSFMEEEITTLLNDFIDYIDNRNLYSFLKQGEKSESILD